MLDVASLQNSNLGWLFREPACRELTRSLGVDHFPQAFDHLLLFEHDVAQKRSGGFTMTYLFRSVNKLGHFDNDIRYLPRHGRRVAHVGYDADSSECGVMQGGPVSGQIVSNLSFRPSYCFLFRERQPRARGFALFLGFLENSWNFEWREL